MTGTRNHTLPREPEKASNTRDAVETAIDTAKMNKTGTWHGGLREEKKITKWHTRKEETTPREHP
jgi:hypothetical protein